MFSSVDNDTRLRRTLPCYGVLLLVGLGIVAVYGGCQKPEDVNAPCVDFVLYSRGLGSSRDSCSADQRLELVWQPLPPTPVVVCGDYETQGPFMTIVCRCRLSAELESTSVGSESVGTVEDGSPESTDATR